MGSAAIYGDAVPLPMREDDCWLGRPHGSEAGYAHAKRTMLAQLEMYREQWGLEFVYCISTNLFGPHDRFDEGGGHVVPSLISKFHRGVVDGGDVVVWGSGAPTRDLLYVGDAARALRVMGEAGSGAINLASGTVVTIGALAGLLADVTGYRGAIVWDRGKPDGQHRREYDLTRLRALGIGAGRPLREGLAETYAWYVAIVILQFGVELVLGGGFYCQRDWSGVGLGRRSSVHPDGRRCIAWLLTTSTRTFSYLA